MLSPDGTMSTNEELANLLESLRVSYWLNNIISGRDEADIYNGWVSKDKTLILPSVHNNRPSLLFHKLGELAETKPVKSLFSPCGVKYELPFISAPDSDRQ